MTPAEALYADLRARGIEFDTDGERLRWRPASLVSPRDAALIHQNRDELVAVLRDGRPIRRCPKCGRPLDSANRCPTCFDRLCIRCGRLTGTYCIQLCFECGHLDDAGGLPVAEPEPGLAAHNGDEVCSMGTGTRPRGRAKLRPPVKWHGGKYYLADWIVSQFPPHRVYLEAFGGAASVLLNKPPADVETYNDIDLRISRLFRVLRDQGEQFLAEVRLVPYSQVEFAAAAEYPPDASDLDMAVCDFVRWRQSFGGQGRSWSYSTGRARGGMAGDVNGWWTAIDGLPRVIERIKRVQVVCQSAFDAIPRFDHPEGLIYCDPPYVHDTRAPGSRAVYHAEMTDGEHRGLARLLRTCKAKVVVSGYPSPLYDELYAGWQVVTADIANHAAGGREKRRQTECLWMNF